MDRSIREPELFVQTNVMGTANMLNCAKEAWELPEGEDPLGNYKEGKKFLHVSTDEVYGSLPEDPDAYFYETTPYAPHSPYSASKASSDLLVKAYMDTYHFPANITNCSNNYGPYQFPEKLIPLMINNALSGKRLPVYGDGRNVRDWLYVEDHCKAIDLEYVEDRKGHDRRYAIAPDKIHRDLGWQPETMFKEGIRKTITWYFEHMDWMEHITSGNYQQYYETMYGDKKVLK